MTSGLDIPILYRLSYEVSTGAGNGQGDLVYGQYCTLKFAKVYYSYHSVILQ